jgi:hypothetical protein
MISKNEAKIDRKSKEANQKDWNVDNSYAGAWHDIKCGGRIDQITEEIGTNLTSTSLEEDHGMLVSKRFK